MQKHYGPVIEGEHLSFSEKCCKEGQVKLLESGKRLSEFDFLDGNVFEREKAINSASHDVLQTPVREPEERRMSDLSDFNWSVASSVDLQVNSEVTFLSRLYHPNIVQFIAACKKPLVYCIITEYMSQGTLKMYLHKKVPYSLSTETILRLALDISKKMQYLHSQGVIHRDIKSHNLLLNDEMRVKVADFGTSCLENQSQESKGNMGTYRWMAPEMIKEKPYTWKVDVYSFSIILWELTTALVPFLGMTPVQAAYAASEKDAHHTYIHDCEVIVDYYRQQLMPRWIPRRLGGGFGGKKESGQLRFGGRETPFRAPFGQFLMMI